MVKNLEEKLGIINEYLAISKVKRELEKDPYNPKIRMQLGKLYGKEDLYNGVPSDAVRAGCESILNNYKKTLEEKVFYEDLINGIPDTESVIRILEILPPLKGNEKIYGLHKKLLETKQNFEELVNLKEENPEELKERIKGMYGKDEGLKYIISSGTEYALRVAAIPLAILRKELYMAIEEVKKKKK